jgi:hypothetical protein
MSVTGMWIIGAIPDREARRLLTDFSDTFGDPGPIAPTAYAEALAWWNDGGDQEPFFGITVPGRPWERDTDAADRLNNLVEGLPEAESAEEAWDECLALMTDKVEHGVYVASARKAAPIAALSYALGAARMSLLPGRFGNFLLSHDAVVANLARIEQAMHLTEAEQEQAVQRIHTWMDEMGDAPNFNAEDLLDGPLRVLRSAASADTGAAAFSRWY